MDPETARQLKEIRGAIDTQTELIMLLMNQGAMSTARLETILSVLREILAKHGIAKETSQRICAEIFARQLPLAQSERQQMIEALEKTRSPDGGNGQRPDQN
jgi:hypothetical protein